MSTPITGFHAIEETLQVQNGGARLFLSRRGPRIERLRHLATARKIQVLRETDAALSRLCGHDDHRGAVLLVDRPLARQEQSLGDFAERLRAEQVLVLMLEGITDPHNLGAVMRSADQFAVDLVVVPRRRAAHETEVVTRISAGASAYVPLLVASNLVNVASQLKDMGFWLYGADVSGRPLSSTDLRGHTAVVMGSEGRGLSRLMRKRCDDTIGITTRGHVDSFNVSVAAGILMYEVRRQQWS